MQKILIIKKTVSDRWPAALAYCVIPLGIGLSYIVKVFFLGNCYAFETNDEVAHTFLEIPLAWSMIGKGTLPLINFFNNFGTPLIGDPVVNPFALHSIPYLFLSPLVAATLNRFLAISLTIALLTFFYHRYFLLSLLASSIAAIWVVTLPAFSHFSVHHPHQGVVLYFTAVLILQHEFKINPSIKTLTGLYAVLLLFALGVGLNPFFFAWPFLIINQFFLSECRINKHFILFSLLSLSIFIFLYPHLSSFFQYAFMTSRATLDYAQILPYTLQRLLQNLFFFRTQPGLLHVSDSIFYSITAIFLTAIGFHVLKNRKDRLRIACLGIVPLFVVLLMLLFGQIRSSWIPLLKSVDITRFLWFANIFLAVLLGYALDFVRKNSLPNFAKNTLLCLLFLSLFIMSKNFIVVCLLLAGMVPVFRAILAKISREKLLDFDLILASWFNRNNRVFVFLVAAGALFFSISPVYLNYSGLSSYALKKCDSFGYAKTYYADFHPKEYLEIIRPYERLATQFEPTAFSYLQQAGKYDIFGSDGRSIILNKGLKQYLLDRNLIEQGWYGMTYYFNFNDTRQINTLGIRYILAARPYDFDNMYLHKPVAQIQDKTNNKNFHQVYLYEAKQDVSVGYLVSDHDINYLHDIIFQDNKISIALPELKNQFDLVLTFVNWPGWIVWIDGQPGDVLSTEAGFLKTVVKPEFRTVIFEFRPYTILQVVGFIAASLLMFGMAVVLFLLFRPLDRSLPQQLHSVLAPKNDNLGKKT